MTQGKQQDVYLIVVDLNPIFATNQASGDGNFTPHSSALSSWKGAAVGEGVLCWLTVYMDLMFLRDCLIYFGFRN